MCPSDPHLHMHTHTDACTHFGADFHLKQWKIIKFKAARTKHIFFFLGKSLTSSHFRPYNIYGKVWIHSFAPKIGGADTISRSHLWVKESNLPGLGISLSRTQEICFAVCHELQAAQEQIHLPFYFLPEKCRLSLLALLRVIAATSLSVCLSVLITAVPLFHILSLLCFFFFFFFCVCL